MDGILQQDLHQDAQVRFLVLAAVSSELKVLFAYNTFSFAFDALGGNLPLVWHCSSWLPQSTTPGHQTCILQLCLL